MQSQHPQRQVLLLEDGRSEFISNNSAIPGQRRSQDHSRVKQKQLPIHIEVFDPTENIQTFSYSH